MILAEFAAKHPGHLTPRLIYSPQSDGGTAMSAPSKTLIDHARAVRVENMLGAHFQKLRRIKQSSEYVGPCPKCGGTDRFSVNTSKQMWHCRRCKPTTTKGDVIGLIEFLDGYTFFEAVRWLTGEEAVKRSTRTVKPAEQMLDEHRARRERQQHHTAASLDSGTRVRSALQMWGETVPMVGTLGERYFAERRGLDLSRLEGLEHVLRWHFRCRCIVALMTDPTSAQAIGIHRTFLDADASKLDRRMLGRAGIIRLSPDDAVALSLGLTEGIEDGIAVLLSGWSPVWAAASAGAIARLPVLAGIESLTLFADADHAGTEAARQCAAHWVEACKEVRISPPARSRDA